MVNTTSKSLTLLSLGSRGDVQPFVALGLALQGAGYHINIATHGIFEDFVRSRGLEFRPVEGNPQEIVQESRQPGLLLTGWGGLTQDDLPQNVFKLDSAPHDWLFPRMKTLVHHGGAGTTAAGLAAGKPNVIVPFFGDQTFWGRRVFELGAGPRPLGRSKLSASALAAAIRQAAESPNMKARPASLGEKIREEHGLEEALRWISRSLQQ